MNCRRRETRKNNNIKFRPVSKGGEEAEEEASGTESEGSSSDKRMKHSSHHADGDELSEDVENMGIEVHDAYPEE